MSQTVQTQFGTGTVVDRENVRGRVSYKVEGPGFSTWIEATAMPLDFQWMPGPDDVQDNSVTLPYNPAPQSWTNPAEQNIQPNQKINPQKRTAPADSLTLQEDGESYEPGPDPKLFATGGLDPEDIQAKLGPKYVNAFVEHDFTSLQARLEEHPEIVMAEARERVAGLVARADQEYLSRVGRNEYLEASDPQLREAAWKDVRAKAVRLRKSGQVNTRGATPDIIMAQVTGDHGTYEVIVRRSNIFQGNSSVDEWSCECPWGQWAFQREHSFVGRLCSHAYASLMELQALTKSKNPNPKFRNHPAVWASRTAEAPSSAQILTKNGWETVPFYRFVQFEFDSGTVVVEVELNGRVQQLELPRKQFRMNTQSSRTAEAVDIGSKIFHRDYADIYGTVVEDDGDAYLVDGDGGEYWIDHEDARLASRTAAKLDELRPGQKVSVGGRNGRIDEIRGDRVTVTFPGEGIDFFRADQINTVLASRTAEIVDLRPVGWDPYSRSLMNRLRDLTEEGSRPGRQKERNEEIRELVTELRERGFDTNGIIASHEAFMDRPYGYGDIPDYGSSADYVLKHELEKREDVEEPEFIYPAGGDHGTVNDLNDGGGERTSALSLPKGTQVQRLNLDGSPSGQTGVVSRDHQGLTEWDQVTVLWDGDSQPSPNDLSEIQWGEYEDGTPTKRLDDPWNVYSANDDYAYGEPPAYGSGDEYGGDENPYYVDPAEQQDWDDPLKQADIIEDPIDYSGGDQFDGAEDPYYVDPMEREDYPEDDVIANFQRNAGWLMGNDGGGSGGNDDIAAAAEAHLRTAGRNFTMAEQQALIDEDDGQPYDRNNLRLRGTHYETGF